MNFRADSLGMTVPYLPGDLVGLSIDEGSELERQGDYHILKLKVSFISYTTPKRHEVWAKTAVMIGRADAVKFQKTKEVVLAIDTKLITSDEMTSTQNEGGDFKIGVEAAKAGANTQSGSSEGNKQQQEDKFKTVHDVVQQLNSGAEPAWRFNPKYPPQSTRLRRPNWRQPFQH